MTRIEIIKLDVPTAVLWEKSIIGHNRPSAPNRVRVIASDMLAGRWRLTGDTIKWCGDEVVDGGHRIRALIEAGKVRPEIAIPIAVAYDVDPETFAVTDTGWTRTVRNSIHMASKGQFTGKSAPLVRWHLLYHKGNVLGIDGRTSAIASKSEVLNHWASDPYGFETSYVRGNDCARQGLGSGRSAALFHLLLTENERIGADRAENFFAKFVSGANLSENSPILGLRNRFLARSRTESRYRQDSAGGQLFLFFRTWEKFCKDQPGAAQLPRTDLTNATFPKLYIPKG